MLAIYFNERYHSDADTPGDAIRVGLDLKRVFPTSQVMIGNDFGDRWPLREYIEKIERFTAIRIPEKEHLPNE